MNKVENNSIDYKLNENKNLLTYKTKDQFNGTYGEKKDISKNINEIIDEIILKLNKMKTSNINEINSLCREVMGKINTFKTLLLQNDNGFSQTSINDMLVKLLEFVTTLNGLKNQLTYLPFNPFKKIYVESCLDPIMSIQVNLTSASSAYMSASRLLAFSTVVKRKTYKIRKYEKAAYRMIDLSNCVNSVLEKRINRFIYINCD